MSSVYALTSGLPKEASQTYDPLSQFGFQYLPSGRDSCEEEERVSLLHCSDSHLSVIHGSRCPTSFWDDGTDRHDAGPASAVQNLERIVADEGFELSKPVSDSCGDMADAASQRIGYDHNSADLKCTKGHRGSDTTLDTTDGPAGELLPPFSHPTAVEPKILRPVPLRPTINHPSMSVPSASGLNHNRHTAYDIDGDAVSVHGSLGSEAQPASQIFMDSFWSGSRNVDSVHAMSRHSHDLAESSEQSRQIAPTEVPDTSGTASPSVFDYQASDRDDESQYDHTQNSEHTITRASKWAFTKQTFLGQVKPSYSRLRSILRRQSDHYRDPKDSENSDISHLAIMYEHDLTYGSRGISTKGRKGPRLVI